VEGCPYQASTNANSHNHFMYMHPYDSIHITDESLGPWDKCELCGLQCPLSTLRSHTESATCIRGQITKRSGDIANNIYRANEQVFTTDGTPIESRGSQKVVTRILTKIKIAFCENSSDITASVLKYPVPVKDGVGRYALGKYDHTSHWIVC